MLKTGPSLSNVNICQFFLVLYDIKMYIFKFWTELWESMMGIFWHFIDQTIHQWRKWKKIISRSSTCNQYNSCVINKGIIHLSKQGISDITIIILMLRTCSLTCRWVSMKSRVYFSGTINCANNSKHLCVDERTVASLNDFPTFAST